MAVVEDLDEGERYLFALMQDASGIDMAEFMWKDETTYDSLFRCYDFQYPWYRDTTQFQIDQSARSVGKAIEITQNVPTPSGWRTMGELEVGDFVYGLDGKPTRVIEAFDVLHDRDCYEIEFSTGEKIVADGDHRWTVHRLTDRQKGNGPSVITTAEMVGNERLKNGWNYLLDVAAPTTGLRGLPLPIPPWLLGYWIGDGTARTGQVTVGAKDYEDFALKVKDLGWSHKARIYEGRGSYVVSLKAPDGTQFGRLLTAVGAKTADRAGDKIVKKVPAVYQLAGVEERQDLVRGFMDADGTVNARSGRASYSQVSEDLARDLMAIVASLGERPTLRRGEAKLYGKKCGYRHRVGWMPQHFNPFCLERKAELVDVGRIGNRVRGRHIKSVTPVDSRPVRCISVDAPDHLFLVGEGYIPTHNSLGIQMRAFAFPFHSPGEEMLLTAPELIHLNPITEKVEDRLLDCRVSAEMLKARGASNGITHRPFEAKFVNGARLVGRIPQKDGKGVKGMHPKVLEQDESQDYPEAGWVELGETLKYGNKDAIWRAHGVSKGVRDRFYKQSQPGSGWKVHRITAMHRNDWTPQEREAKAELYGSRDHPDYRRNILGLHGDAQSALFVLARLMACHPGNTPIHALERGVQTIKPLRDVRVGDTVLNAKGAGTVIDVIPSRHRVLLGVEVAGEVVHCTPEHPFLTTVGWRHADQLNIGDHILTTEDMRELWQGADRDAAAVLLTELLSRQALGEDQDREGIPARTPVRDVRGGADIEGTEAILLAGVLGQGSSSSDKSVPGLRNGVRGVEPKDLLLAGLRGQAEASTQSQARNPLSALRHDDHRRQGLLEVLHARLLECVEDPDLPGADLPGVRGGLHGPEHETLLLALLLCESEWPDTQDQSPSGGEGLRTLRGDVLPPGQEDQVLLEEVRQHRDSGQEAVAGRRLRTLRSYVQAEQANPSMVLEGMLVRSETGRAGSQESRRPPEARGSRRVASITVRSLDGTRGTGVGLGAAEMALSSGGIGRGPGVVHSGPVSSPIEDYRGGGWVEPSPRGGQEQGCDPGRVAGFARVDRIEVLEPGHPDWDRLSGGEDHVVCYDLTVSGHPSYAVGESALLVHNCVDSTQSSPYNEHEYHSVRITEEKFNDSGLPIEALLELPGAHKAYGTVWVGMDIGLTNDPSEILVFGETSESHSGKNRNPESSVLKLLTRIHLQRISAPNQRKVVEEVFNHYRPQAIALDRTGLGLPIYQEIMEDGGAAFQNSIRAYNFSEKILVGYEKEEELDETMWWEDQEPEPIMANVLEYSSDMLRLLVDTGRIHLPYDVTLIREFQGQTYQITKSSTNPYGRKVFSKGEYHALDAARMAAVGFFQEQVGNLAPRELEPVLDSFVMG